MNSEAPPCPLCGRATQPLFRLHDSPHLQNVFFDTREEALATPRGDFGFRYCGGCHHGFNPEFRADLVAYDPSYNNDQTSSSGYRGHIEAVIDHLVEHGALGAQSRVLEVGCGNGYFLSRVEARTGIEAHGFDPAYNGQFGQPARIRREGFRPVAGEIFDLVILRHCLDAFTDPDSILRAVVQALGPAGQLYVESADLDHILRAADFSLFFHEYARYFSKTSLAVYLGQHGLVLDSARPSFGGQYYSCLFRPAPGTTRLSAAPGRIGAALDGFQKILIWGVSGRAVTILTHLSLGTDRVACAVDIAPAKQGRYLPVTGQRVLSPAEAVAFQPDLVLIPNRNYENEIRPLFPTATRILTLHDASS